MLFNSNVFLLVFLPITYLVFWRLHTRTQRHLWLTATSYVFYGWWDARFCLLMAFSTLVSYLAGLGFLRFPQPRAQRALLVVPIAIDLALLGFFKYTNFALQTAATISAFLGGTPSTPYFDIVLPVGISFYTFHTISYIVDSYRGTIKPTRNLGQFACYVSLFSQLVAGPIVRFREIQADLEHLDRMDRRARLEIGWSFFAIGMLKKVLIADRIAAHINPALADIASLSTVGAWACALGFAYQLYFDFSGYSDMAVGLGHMFGVHIPQNFRSPYIAVDVADFWRRWHISLSSCLRDYLYIPLGGSRGSMLRVSRNLMLTMLIGGLWHGANWTFVVWGAYHGGLLILHRVCQPYSNRLPMPVRRGCTFVLVVVGWVFFRADSLGLAGLWLARMWSPTPGALPTAPLALGVWLIVAARFAHFGPNTFELRHTWRGWEVLLIACAFAVCLWLIQGAEQAPFLYFQF